jgi:hypothetical protein
MVPSPLSPPRLLTLCTLATLSFGAGCSPDSPNVAGPNAHFEQETAGATQISGIGSMRELANVTTPRVRGPPMTSS